MNVLIINGSSDMYGASRILLQTIIALKPRKVFLIVPCKGLLTEFFKASKEYSHVRIYIVPSNPVVYRKMGIIEGARLLNKMIFFTKTIKRIINEHKIDWAYVNTLSCLFAVPPLKICRLKVFLHVHEILENNKISTRYINKFALKWCNKIVTVSEPVKFNLFKVASEKEKQKIITVLNGIADMYRPIDKKSTEKNLAITLIGRIKPEKGIWFFLNTLSLLPEYLVKKCTFIIVGGSAPGGEHFLEKLKTDILHHPAKKYIKYYPFSSDVTDIVNASDIIVVPSLMKDPFPTTILEGLSAGKPVIATNSGGAVQSIKDTKTGFLIEPLNKVEFADRLKQLIESDLLRTEMGKQARQDFLENFTLKIFETNFIKEVNEFEKTNLKAHFS